VLAPRERLEAPASALLVVRLAEQGAVDGDVRVDPQHDRVGRLGGE
jgi:hypothetical protein